MNITIQGSWKTLNEYIASDRRNRFLGGKMKKEEMERIEWQLKGIPPIHGKVDITFQAYLKNKKKDPDGAYTYFLKAFLDSLVNMEIIPNDTQEFIGRIIFEPIKIDKEERMVVEIQES